MKSAGNEGIVHGRLQMLHVHVFLAAPLGARHMAEPGADQHQGGVAIGERPHHAGSAADLTVQPLNHVVGADARQVLAGKVTISSFASHHGYPAFSIGAETMRFSPYFFKSFSSYSR